MTSVAVIFVYGTLQQGEARAALWPHPPTHVETATTRGTLYDLGPYPALIEGGDVIRGELWYLAPDTVAESLQVLDQIEGFRQPGENDLYVRRVVTCHTADGRAVQAWTYHFARPDELPGAQRLAPDAEGSVGWHAFR